MDKNVTKSVSEQVEFKTGDQVTFRNTLGKIIEGRILGLNTNTAIVEYKNNLGKETKTEIKYEGLTKIQK